MNVWWWRWRKGGEEDEEKKTMLYVGGSSQDIIHMRDPMIHQVFTWLTEANIRDQSINFISYETKIKSEN